MLNIQHSIIVTLGPATTNPSDPHMFVSVTSDYNPYHPPTASKQTIIYPFSPEGLLIPVAGNDVLIRLYNGYIRGSVVASHRNSAKTKLILWLCPMSVIKHVFFGQGITKDNQRQSTVWMSKTKTLDKLNRELSIFGIQIDQCSS